MSQIFQNECMSNTGWTNECSHYMFRITRWTTGFHIHTHTHTCYRTATVASCYTGVYTLYMNKTYSCAKMSAHLASAPELLLDSSLLFCSLLEVTRRRKNTALHQPARTQTQCEWIQPHFQHFLSLSNPPAETLLLLLRLCGNNAHSTQHWLHLKLACSKLFNLTNIQKSKGEIKSQPVKESRKLSIRESTPLICRA